MNEKFQILTNDKEIHFRIDPTITFEEMCKEMKELIEIYDKANKAYLHHYNPKSHQAFKNLKDPEYLKWYKEKIHLEREASVAYSNVATLARYFCPKIYIV